MKKTWKMILILIAVFCLLVPAAVSADEYDKYLSPWESTDIGAEVREAGELRFSFHGRRRLHYAIQRRAGKMGRQLPRRLPYR